MNELNPVPPDAPQPAVLRKPTVAMWCEEYKAERYPRFTPATRDIVDRELVRFALFMGHREISSPLLHEYMAIQRNRTSGKTLLKVISWVGSFLRWAEEIGHLDKKYSSLSILKPKTVVVIQRPALRFSPEQYEALKEVTKGTPWHYASIMAYRTGARLSDVCLLKWESVHMEKLYLHYLPWKSRKTQRYATCPFLAGGDLHNILIELLAARDTHPQWGEYVCPELAKRYPVTGRYANEALCDNFASFCKKIGAPHLSFHKLRNSWMSRAVDAGLPFAQARQLSGLGSDSVFMRYAVPDVRVLRTAIEKMEATDHLPPAKKPLLLRAKK